MPNKHQYAALQRKHDTLRKALLALVKNYEDFLRRIEMGKGDESTQQFLDHSVFPAEARIAIHEVRKLVS